MTDNQAKQADSNQPSVEPSPPKLCIGIDLGTTNSVIAYYNPDTDQVDMIPNTEGERLTPSCVFFPPDSQEILVGQLALEAETNFRADQDMDDPDSIDYRCISHVKHFIGLKQHQCQESLENMEYEITVDHDGYPLIPVSRQPNNPDCPVKKYKPEEISAHVLYYLKRCAEDCLGQKITQAVVTVPAYFNEAQRRATKDACVIAGMECLRLVAEPTAACLCYGLHKTSREQNLMVFDTGGGTLDVSILNLREGIFQVRGTSGNSQLGGADVDHTLAEFLNHKYHEQKKDTSRGKIASI